ncbi:single-strand DNA endonuclease 1 isoform X2 [Andrographis paniculata]|uniref:single-strand DNA endonuclease 1 isoform X2 n=1 Tax=Andrographis paniculata TaxID=175694 RepID=UPI0021E7E3BB|nr:single-strand DNA endonuclease 1 isoform X2 [Andrographis paniculata]
MGVKNLWDILESCKKRLPLHHLRNKRVCVDLSCWIVQLCNANKSHCVVKEKLYLKSLFHRLRALIALNCSLIFVTDGSIPAIKVSTYRRRLNAGSEPHRDAGNQQNVSSVKRNMGSEFSCMIKDAKLLGGALGIPCLDGIEEAEAQCAFLNSESLCDGCFTLDSDVFLFGARTVYRDICLADGGYVVCYEMDDIEAKLGFGRNSLITLAVLLGSDYSQGVRGFGPESACQIVKAIGDSSVLQRFVSEGLSITKKQKGSKRSHNSTHDNKENDADHRRKVKDNPFLQVIDAYLRPKCHSADSVAVHRVLALYPFDRSELHQICAKFFEWPPEKTDEYILPKIAERNLRRFANLRSSSSALQLNLPIEEMPVKCPVSSIVKQRKIQGRDYFEVSWEAMDGLESSVVPADLIESACPEKIVEFFERKARKQKPARKPRAKTKEVEMKELDKKLQELLLDIDQARTTATNAISFGVLSSTKILSPVAGIDRALQSRHIHNFSGGQDGEDGICKEASSSETEVIDLISPPPECRRHRARSVDVIDLTDSDVGASPEHARKARELRLFVASIRDEINAHSGS